MDEYLLNWCSGNTLDMCLNYSQYISKCGRHFLWYSSVCSCKWHCIIF